MWEPAKISKSLLACSWLQRHEHVPPTRLTQINRTTQLIFTLLGKTKYLLLISTEVSGCLLLSIVVKWIADTFPLPIILQISGEHQFYPTLVFALVVLTGTFPLDPPTASRYMSWSPPYCKSFLKHHLLKGTSNATFFSHLLFLLLGC